MRRVLPLLLAALLLPVAAAGQDVTDDLPRLEARAPLAQQEDVLRAALLGRPVEGLGETLRRMGARDLLLTDLARTDLPRGTEVAPGLAAGDPVVSAIFGLRAGFLRPDRRLRVSVRHEDGVMTDLVGLQSYAK